MKYTLTIVLSLSVIFSYGQFKVKQPRELQHRYLFSTENPSGKGKVDWGFHDSIIYRDITIGGKIVKQDSFRTQKPFIFMDSAGVVAYMYETERGPMTIMYDDVIQDLTVLVLGLGKHPKSYPIYGVVHFW